MKQEHLNNVRQNLERKIRNKKIGIILAHLERYQNQELRTSQEETREQMQQDIAILERINSLHKDIDNLQANLVILTL